MSPSGEFFCPSGDFRQLFLSYIHIHWNLHASLLEALVTIGNFLKQTLHLPPTVVNAGEEKDKILKDQTGHSSIRI